MKIKFFCPRWGSEKIPWNEFCEKVKAAGFHGIETPVPLNDFEKKEIAYQLKKYHLSLIGQYYQSFEKNFAENVKNFKTHLENIASLQPSLIDSQTGKDFFSLKENKELFELAEAVSKERGILIAHETHRNKALFAAHITKQLLIENPGIYITADFSHWCNVSESLLEQQQEAMQIAICRTVHIHARVGHAQAAQVSDPRAPEWEVELKAHLAWWDQIVECRAAKGADLLTITPEFGPIPYMQTKPFSNEPLADQWDINVYILNLLKDRYKAFIL